MPDRDKCRYRYLKPERFVDHQPHLWSKPNDTVDEEVKLQRGLADMSTRTPQEEVLATIARLYDAGDFEYLSPKNLQRLNQLIADDRAAFRQGSDVEARIGEIQQILQA